MNFMDKLMDYYNEKLVTTGQIDHMFKIRNLAKQYDMPKLREEYELKLDNVIEKLRDIKMRYRIEMEDENEKI